MWLGVARCDQPHPSIPRLAQDVKVGCPATVGCLSIPSISFILIQPWESVAAVGNAAVNAVLCGIYDAKKIAVVRVICLWSLF